MQTGQVYKIICKKSNEVYIGSTFLTLKTRWRYHRNDYKRWLANKHSGCSIYKYFKKYGIDNFEIIPIKEYMVCDKRALLVYETLWIYKTKNSVNQITPFIIFKPNYQTYIEYNLNYDRNVRVRPASHFEKFDCECGGKYMHRSRSKHFKTQKHTNYLN
jgi:hypothetical protein